MYRKRLSVIYALKQSLVWIGRRNRRWGVMLPPPWELRICLNTWNSSYQLEEIRSVPNSVCVCVSTFFLALHMLQAHRVYFLHSLKAAISPRSPGSLHWRTILTKIWAVDVLTATGVPLLLGLLSRKSKKTCVCIPTLMWISIYKYFLCIHLWLYETKYQFILKSSTIIHY